MEPRRVFYACPIIPGNRARIQEMNALELDSRIDIVAPRKLPVNLENRFPQRMEIGLPVMGYEFEGDMPFDAIMAFTIEEIRYLVAMFPSLYG